MIKKLRNYFLNSVLKKSLFNPVISFRRKYLPFLMIYFSYGALGIVGIAENFWVKKELTLSPVKLAELGVWLTIPWSIKMIFAQFVDCVPIFKSKRSSYALIGAFLVALGLIVLAGAAGGWISFASMEILYIISSFLTVIGVVMQDVVADTMTTELVERKDKFGKLREKEEINHDLAMAQILGRLSLSFGTVTVAWLSGWLAKHMAYEKVFLIGLIIPLISISGVFLVKIDQKNIKLPIDWKILGPGIAFGILILILNSIKLPFSQEIIFIISMLVISILLYLAMKDLDKSLKAKMLAAIIVIFAFRATPGVGVGMQWWMIDDLKFDEEFFGILSQISVVLAIIGMWLLSEYIARKKITAVMLWLTIIGTIFSLPELAVYYKINDIFNISAKTVIIADTALASPLAHLSMIPMLTLIAIYAPKGKRATWFALMASLMNLALITGQLQTKYLNKIFIIERGSYAELGYLMMISIIIGALVPIIAIIFFGKKAE